VPSIEAHLEVYRRVPERLLGWTGRLRRISAALSA
jgi:hypothetical protein